MTFGTTTVTFVSYADTGTPGSLGTYEQAETLTPVAGCRHRPLTFRETSEYDVNVTTEAWKTTCPPDPAVLAAKSDGTIRVDGIEYKILGGPAHYTDMEGAPFKVTILSERTTS